MNCSKIVTTIFQFHHVKKIVLTYILVVSVCGYINAQASVEIPPIKLNWQRSFTNAQKLTISEKKPLLIFFTGSDWCGPCKMLVSDFFESEKFTEIAEKELILYEADFPRSTYLVTPTQKLDNDNLKGKYNVSSFPTVIIVDENGKLLGKMKGYNLMRNSTYHFTFVDAVLKKVR